MREPAEEDVARDRDPTSQTQDDGVVAIAKEVISEITDDDVPGLAAEVAYHAIFSIPAILVVFATLAALINNVAEYNLETRLNEIINDSAPASSRPMLRDLVENAVAQVDGGAATIGLAGAVVAALWAGSNGVGALIKAFNRAYDATERRSFPRMKGASILLTIMLGGIVNLAFALWVFGEQIGSWLAGAFGMGSTFDWVWNLSRIPVGVLVTMFMLGLLYYFGPTTDQKVRSVLPGTVLATVLWGALVLGFSVYMYFANPGSAYGALGGVIVFLFFLYLTSLVFIVGAELNAVLARRYEERYQEAVVGDIAEPQFGDAPRIAASPSSGPSTMGSLALGAVTTVGIVLAALVGRRRL